MGKEITKKTEGYLLVEVLTSLFVIVILVTIGALILNLSNVARSRAENAGEANAIAFAKIQEYELKQYEDINEGSAGVNDYEVEDFSADIMARPGNKFENVVATVHVMNESATLKKLWLSMYYEFGGAGSNIEYATYIQVGGVGR